MHGTELVLFVKGSDEWQLEEPLLFLQCACRHLLHAPDFADRNRRNVSHILCDKVQSYFDFLDSFRNLGVIANNFESYHLTSEVVDLGEHKRYSRLIVAPHAHKALSNTDRHRHRYGRILGGVRHVDILEKYVFDSIVFGEA